MLPAYYHIPSVEQSRRDWKTLMEARGNVFSFRRDSPVDIYPYYASYEGPRDIPPHFHAFLEIILVLSGSADVRINGRAFTARAGDILFSNDLEEHSETIRSRRMEKLIIGFLPAAADDALSAASHTLYGAFALARPFSPSRASSHVHLDNDAALRVRDAWLMLIHEFANGGREHLRMHFRSLLSLIVHGCGFTAAKAQPITPVLDYLAAHASESTNVTKAVAYSGMSRSHFYRVFHSATGMPVTAYVNHLRIEKAKRLLTATSLPIPRIAAELGFTDAAYFHRVFKRSLGKTPEVYRREGDTPG